MTQPLFPTRSDEAYDRYSRDLSNALETRVFVSDPSFALNSDQRVYEKVRRDAVTAHAIQQRRHLVAGRGYTITPASKREVDVRAAGIVETLIDQIHGFSQARFELADAVFRGSTYAFMDGGFQTLSVEDEGTPMDWWVPNRLIDVDRRRFRLARVQQPGEIETHLQWHMWSVERQQWEPLTNPQWFVKNVYDDTEDTLSYGRGLIDALHYYQASKMRVLQEGLSAAERFGQGWIDVGVDSLRPGSAVETNQAVADAYLEQIEKQRARFAFVHAKEDEVKLMTGAGEGWQLIKELLGYLDTSIRVLVLGSNLPSSATEGGSYALAQVQENTTEALIQFDRQILSESLTRDLVGLVWALNATNLRVLGLSGAKPPALAIRQEKREDPTENVAVISQAVAAGIPLRKDEVYERLGFTPPEADDDVLGGVVPAAAAAAVEGAGGREREGNQIQDTALNGAQISSLQEVISAVSQKLLPAGAAIEMLTIAFPSISPEAAKRMVDSASAFQPGAEALQAPKEPAAASLPELPVLNGVRPKARMNRVSH